jgi:hypothetical protein
VVHIHRNRWYKRQDHARFEVAGDGNQGRVNASEALSSKRLLG